MFLQGYVVGIRDSPVPSAWFVTFHEGVPRIAQGDAMAKIFTTYASAQTAARQCTVSTGELWAVYSLNDFIRMTRSA